MVKVKVLCRNTKEYTSQTNKDITKMPRNPTKTQLHPFQGAREYQRALNAAKMEKLFAKPFLDALDVHSDGVTVMSKSRANLTDVLSGSADGEIVFWNLPERKHTFQINAHQSFVQGLSFAGNHTLAADTIFVSTGTDKKVCIWSVNGLKEQLQAERDSGNFSLFKNYKPKAAYSSKHLLLNCDHSYENQIFATSGAVVQIWNYERSAPIQTFDTWHVETVSKLKFNPSETNLIASVGMDRSLCFYDLRGKSALKKVYMKNKSSALCWNPQEPMNIVIGNENSNCYTFDMRKLDEPKMIHKDHLQAVLDIDFAPTGKEFATASYDKTIRIFPYNDGRSREVYHTKRMQQVNAILYSNDAKYIATGSEDTNIRIWKSNAADTLKPLLPREKEKLAYANKLKKKYKYAREVKRILRHRHLPKLLVKKQKLRQVKKESRYRKDENMRANNRVEDRPFVPQRKVDLDANRID